MNIDFTKLKKMLLPTFLRVAFLQLVNAISAPFVWLYTEFNTWKTDIALQAQMTSQVMYLEAILNYRLLGTFDRVIKINDGDGLSVDFIIIIPNGIIVDSYRLIALADKYKTYGKRYRIDQVTYSYTCEWGGFVCEKYSKTYTCEWGGFVCEKVEQATECNITLNLEFGGINIADGVMKINSQYPVASDLIVTVKVVTDANTYYENIPIASGSQYSEKYFSYPDAIIVYSISSIAPQSDNMYNYIPN